jgi:hypothetical protein
MSTTCEQWLPKIAYGDTWRTTLTYKVGGEPVDLSDYTAVLTVSDGTEDVFALSTETDGGLVLGADGTIAIEYQLEATQKGKYELRLVLTSPDGIVKTLIIVSVRRMDVANG